jgi:hypothetical protein
MSWRSAQVRLHPDRCVADVFPQFNAIAVGDGRADRADGRFGNVIPPERAERFDDEAHGAILDPETAC